MDILIGVGGFKQVQIFMGRPLNEVVRGAGVVAIRYDYSAFVIGNPQ